MLEPTPAKRRRGGQPGNQNSKGNRGNRFARGKLGNRGGKGAPKGNQRASKRHTLLADVQADYAQCPEALAWISEHPELARVEVSHDSHIKNAVYSGLTPDELAKKGREFKLGLYVDPRQEGELRERSAA
jgi:hypothetical protein